MARNKAQQLAAVEHLVDLVALALRLGWQPRPAQVRRLNVSELLLLGDAEIDVLTSNLETDVLTSNLETWISKRQGAIAAPVAAG